MIRSFSELIKEQEDELSRILEFWLKAIDYKNGGFYGTILGDGIIQKDASRGAILNCRILWTFSAAYNYNKNEKYLKAASHVYQYLKKYFIDSEFGGVFWEVDANGHTINTRKQAYAQGFAVYGFSEYYRASGDEDSLDYAKSIFHLIEEKFWDDSHAGYIEALASDWTHLEDMRLSEKEENFPKSMNTHLHILEPYTNLYRVWKDPKLAKAIAQTIRVFLDRIINHTSANFHLMFEADWTVKSNIVSYGHDIEGSWLLAEAAEELGDENLIQEVNEMAVRMVDVSLENGLDEDGALFYETENGHLDTDKHWWPQAEAMIGCVNAWQITGENKYLQHAERFWNFISLKLVDNELGEWFWRVDKRGNPYLNDVKAGFWKCPYHNTRALIEVCNRLKK